jgi:hypothetical protein
MRITAAAIATLLALSCQANAAPRGWKKYDGPWFQIYAPPGWKATPKKQLARVDSAVFTSPDGRAQFTLFSPLWNGDPAEIKRDAKRERLVAERSSTIRGDLDSTIRVKWQTFKTLDGRWTRSVVDRENVTLNTRLTFGFAYRDQKTYLRYLKAYETFKGSLVQFAD